MSKTTFYNILLIFVAYSSMVAICENIKEIFLTKKGGEHIGPIPVTMRPHTIKASIHYTQKADKLIKKNLIPWKRTIRRALLNVQNNILIQNLKLLIVNDPYKSVNNPKNQESIEELTDFFHDVHDSIYVHCRIVFHVVGKSTSGNSPGVSEVNSMCTRKNIIVVDIGKKLKDQEFIISSSIIRNLGFCLGAEKMENYTACGCEGSFKEHCAMQDFHTRAPKIPILFYDKCNLEKIVNRLNNNDCDDYINRYKNSGFGEFTRCGDGLVDVDEECDCGSPVTCTLFNHTNCCDPRTCRLLDTNDLEEKMRCPLCEYFKEKPCRASKSPCDLEEYCTDDMLYCPPDLIDTESENCTLTTTTAVLLPEIDMNKTITDPVATKIPCTGDNCDTKTEQI